MNINVSILIAVIGCLVGLAGWLRNHDSDKQKDIAQQTQVIVSLETIKNDTREIKNDLKDIKNDVRDHEKRLTIIEQEMKSFHSFVKGDNK